jgi:hypothetical protein
MIQDKVEHLCPPYLSFGSAHRLASLASIEAYVFDRNCMQCPRRRLEQYAPAEWRRLGRRCPL